MKSELRVAFDGVEASEQVIARVRKAGDTCLLAFSCGKDSIGAWLAIREHFKRVIPFYRYLVPGLEFVEESLRYYEDFFGTEIMRVPHPSLYRLLSNFVFQPPERTSLIEWLSVGEFDYDDQRLDICDSLGIPQDTFIANGTRAADSLQRRTHFKAHGAINYNGRQFYPIWDYTKAGLIDILKRADVALPIDYWIFGRSFDGIDFRFLYPLKKHFPKDFERILEWFPLAELEIKRFEYMPKTKQHEESEIDKAMAALGDATAELEGLDLNAQLAKLDLPPSPLESIDYDKKTYPEATEAEMSETLKAFREARAGERRLFQETTDSEYWCCFCFQSREQKDAFLKALGLFGIGDKYLDGLRVAEKLKVALPEAGPRFVQEQCEKRLTRELKSIRKP